VRTVLYAEEKLRIEEKEGFISFDYARDFFEEEGIPYLVSTDSECFFGQLENPIFPQFLTILVNKTNTHFDVVDVSISPEEIQGDLRRIISITSFLKGMAISEENRIRKEEEDIERERKELEESLIEKKRKDLEEKEIKKKLKIIEEIEKEEERSRLREIRDREAEKRRNQEILEFQENIKKEEALRIAKEKDMIEEGKIRRLREIEEERKAKEQNDKMIKEILEKEKKSHRVS